MPYLLPFTIYVESKFAWPWLRPLEWLNDKYKYILCMGNNSIAISWLFTRYSQMKYAWPWIWPLEWANVTCKYTNRKPIIDFLCIGNNNFDSICHNLHDIHNENIYDFQLEILEWVKVKYKYTNLKSKSDFLCAGNCNACSLSPCAR